MDSRQALIRDLARLFVKYDLEDWQFILNTLREGGPELALLQDAVEDLVARGSRPRPFKDSHESVRAVFSDLEKKDAEKADILKQLYDLMKKKDTAPRLADIRNFCVAAGIKASPPKRRDDAIVFLIKELARVEDKAFLAHLLRQLPVRDRDLHDEYRGWFRMIYPDSDKD